MLLFYSTTTQPNYTETWSTPKGLQLKKKLTKLVSHGEGISYDTDSSDNEDNADDDAMEIDSEVGDEETTNIPASVRIPLCQVWSTAEELSLH